MSRHVTRFVHIRVPDDTSAEQMQIILNQFKTDWVQDPELIYGIIDIDVDRPYRVGACHADACPAEYHELCQLAYDAAFAVRAALPNSDPAVVVSSERFVIRVEHEVEGLTVVQHTDNREKPVEKMLPMRTLYHFMAPKTLPWDRAEFRVDMWHLGEHPPFPCNIIRLVPGDNLVIENLPEGEDLDEAIKLIHNVLNNPDREIALITYEGLTLQRCGANHE